MEWFSWLSKTGLEPSLVYRYGVAFAHNELDRDDLPYFNHEFLQSMGISVAKHRLEILKLARRDAAPNRIRVSRMLIAAVNRTRRCLSKHLRAWARRGDPSALALVPIRSCSKRAAAAASKPNATPLLLTNGSPMLFGSSRINSFASPNFEEGDFEDDRRVVVDAGDWASDIRWDTMFQDLKPT